MRVVISSVGRFPFGLARQLNAMGYLERLFTGYPMWKVDADLRPKTTSFPWIVTPQMALFRYGLESLANRLSLPATYTLDHWVASRLPDCDVFVGLSQSGLYTIRAARRRGIRTVCERQSSHIVVQNTILMEEYQRQGVPFKGIARWAIEKELQEYAEADLIKVPSNFARRTFIEQGISEERVISIPFGIDVKLFNPLPKEDKVFRILYVGTLSLQKGIPYLLDAVKGLTSDKIELWLIGSELKEIRPTLARYADRFRYWGVLPRSELKWYYSQASVFVMPSLQEGMANVMVQAMACGVPIIATSNTGADDLFTDGVEGFIVPIRDPNAIRERILYLYENPDIRDQMGQAALRRIESLGGWSEHGQLTIKAFRKLLQAA